jgi:hypothetical protein
VRAQQESNIIYLLIVGAMLGAATLSYCGFCFMAWQFLPDDQAIDAATDDALNMSVQVVESARSRRALARGCFQAN